MEEVVLNIEGVQYTVPKSQVEAIILPNEGQLYVRIRFQRGDFELIYSEKRKYRRNWQGSSVPLVTHVNDAPAQGFDETSFPHGPTVCRKGVPYASCGLLIEDEGIPWSVLFDPPRVPESELIRSEARKLLSELRRVEGGKRS